MRVAIGADELQSRVAVPLTSSSSFAASRTMGWYLFQFPLSNVRVAPWATLMSRSPPAALVLTVRLRPSVIGRENFT